MSRVEVERPVSHAPDAVWKALADFGGIHRFHPMVERSPLTGDAATGLGATRTCHFHDGNHIDEEIVGWEEGSSMTVKIVRGTMPVTQAHAVLSVEPTPTGSVVRMAMDYQPKWGVVGKLMDAVMMRRQFRKVVGSILEGLDRHVATGELIGPKTLAVA